MLQLGHNPILLHRYSNLVTNRLSIEGVKNQSAHNPLNIRQGKSEVKELMVTILPKSQSYASPRMHHAL